MPRYVNSVVFCLCLLPLAWIIGLAIFGKLSANPIEKITHLTGDWTIRFLWITLSVTPLRILTGYSSIVKLRRMLGLFTFFYACLHFLTYIVLDQFFNLGEIFKDILKRPYITIGFTGFILMIPLAITSTAAMARRLGKRWKQLHQLIYFIAVCALFHYLWLVKADTREPLIYATILCALFLVRYLHERRQRRAKRLIENT